METWKKLVQEHGIEIMDAFPLPSFAIRDAFGFIQTL